MQRATRIGWAAFLAVLMMGVSHPIKAEVQNQVLDVTNEIIDPCTDWENPTIISMTGKMHLTTQGQVNEAGHTLIRFHANLANMKGTAPDGTKYVLTGGSNFQFQLAEGESKTIVQTAQVLAGQKTGQVTLDVRVFLAMDGQVIVTFGQSRLSC